MPFVRIDLFEGRTLEQRKPWPEVTGSCCPGNTGASVSCSRHH